MRESFIVNTFTPFAEIDKAEFAYWLFSALAAALLGASLLRGERLSWPDLHSPDMTFKENTWHAAEDLFLGAGWNIIDAIPGFFCIYALILQQVAEPYFANKFMARYSNFQHIYYIMASILVYINELHDVHHLKIKNNGTLSLVACIFMLFSAGLRLLKLCHSCCGLRSAENTIPNLNNRPRWLLFMSSVVNVFMGLQAAWILAAGTAYGPVSFFLFAASMFVGFIDCVTADCSVGVQQPLIDVTDSQLWMNSSLTDSLILSCYSDTEYDSDSSENRM